MIYRIRIIAIVCLWITLGMLWTTSVFAENVYTQNTDSRYIEYNDTMGNNMYFGLVGSFTTGANPIDATTLIGKIGLYARDDINNYGEETLPRGDYGLFLSTTTNPQLYNNNAVLGFKTENLASSTMTVVDMEFAGCQGQGCILQPNTTYYMNIGKHSGQQFFLSSAVGISGQAYAVIASETYSELLIPQETSVIYLDPSSDEVVASSTPVDLYASVFVSDEDWKNDMFLRLIFSRNVDKYRGAVQDLSSLINPVYGVWSMVEGSDTDFYIDFPSSDLSSGVTNNLSTTTEFLLDGRYTMTAELRSPTWYGSAWSWISSNNNLDVFGIGNLFDPDLVVASSTSFVVGGKSSFDLIYDEMAGLTGIAEDGSASTTLAMIKDACNPISGFDLTICLRGLIVPTGAEIGDDLLDFVSYPPVGYLTRAITIMSSSATSSLPVLSYEFSTSTQVLPISGTFSFNPWKYFYQDGSPVKDDLKSRDGRNIWDIFSPVITIVIYLSLFFVVLRDLAGLHIKASDKNEL